jgi:hypothetical protein
LTDLIWNLPFVNEKAYVLAILNIFLNLKSYKYFPRKTTQNLRFLRFDCSNSRTLTLRVIFDFEPSFLGKVPSVNEKAYVLAILNIFSNLKFYKYFPRKNVKFTIFTIWLQVPYLLVNFARYFRFLNIIFGKSTFYKWKKTVFRRF